MEWVLEQHKVGLLPVMGVVVLAFCLGGWFFQWMLNGEDDLTFGERCKRCGKKW